MSGRDDAPVVVAGSTDDGFRWAVRSWREPDDEVMTTLSVVGVNGTRGEGGFGGPALHPGELVNSWVGTRSEQPTFLLVRARADVTAVEVSSRKGATTVPLSPVMADLGLRFGVHRVADDDEVLSVTAHRAGVSRNQQLRRPPSR